MHQSREKKTVTELQRGRGVGWREHHLQSEEQTCTGICVKLGNGILPGARNGLFRSQSIGDFSNSMILLHHEHINSPHVLINYQQLECKICGAWEDNKICIYMLIQ